jgi:hypothetical protein
VIVDSPTSLAVYPCPTTLAALRPSGGGPNGDLDLPPGPSGEVPEREESLPEVYCYSGVPVSHKNEASFSSRTGPTRPLQEHHRPRRSRHHDPSLWACRRGCQPDLVADVRSRFDQPTRLVEGSDHHGST